METIINVMLGFQIGMVLVACYFAIKIALIKITPQAYYVAAGNLFLVAFLRANLIFTFFPNIIHVSLLVVVSFLWMIFFIKIYYLIKNKHE